MISLASIFHDVSSTQKAHFVNTKIGNGEKPIYANLYLSLIILLYFIIISHSMYTFDFTSSFSHYILPCPYFIIIVDYQYIIHMITVEFICDYYDISVNI